ncbi:hypothetical protein PYW08_010991 [Mythimna loreyi]|uniref:Uncharacterized protein n=1 Tax=Mythimna loreyi TaxID=667449 RepID=A0ACC2Q2W2_9NEOP|nr:hypothetical protein PYW08_010991 [Mythimna loreyi]
MTMFLRAIIISWCLFHSSAHPPWPKPPQCLTGYMTDVQKWVDETGRLIITNLEDEENSIDLSTSANPVQTLHQKMTLERKSNRLVKYLSLARCQLPRVPPIFQLRDSQLRTLASTLEYLTLYGNSFLGMSNAGEHYTLTFNATGSSIMSLSSSPQRQQVDLWSAGFSAVTFPNLKELDLRACSIQVLGPNLFRGMSRLTSLYIGENEIYFIDATAFYGLKRLVHLDFSRNKAFDENGNPKNLITGSYFAFQHLESLVSLDMSYTKLMQRNLGMIKSLGKSLKSLSICETGLNNLTEDIFMTTSLQILDVSRNNGILNVNKALRGLEQNLVILNAQEIGLQSFDIFRNFTKLMILQLGNNEINNIRDVTVKTLNKIKILDLNRNRISSWFEPIYSLMPELRFLSLNNNNINVITQEMIQDMMNIEYVDISDNFLVCNCHSKDFYKMAAKNEIIHKDHLIKPDGADYQLFHNGFRFYNALILNRSKITLEDCDSQCFEDIGDSGKFRFVDYEADNYVCMLIPESKTTYIADVNSCEKSARDVNYEQQLAGGKHKLLALLVIPCTLLPVAMIFIFRRHIRYFFITMRNSAMLSLINKNEVVDDNTIFNYDVFVSYCNEDRGWVLDHLLPHMEQECSISACLHERDFLVGLSILENIVSCMDRSRSIMLILSQQFLLSQWCQFEMHLAQHRLLETRREDLTLILLEEIPRRLRPNTLHYLMLTKTYIVWPKDEAERPIFWKRLKKTLIAQKAKPTENVSLA